MLTFIRCNDEPFGYAIFDEDGDQRNQGYASERGKNAIAGKRSSPHAGLDYPLAERGIDLFGTNDQRINNKTGRVPMNQASGRNEDWMY